MKLRIRHDTHYRYSAPVSLSQHHLYLRPREHSGQRVTAFDLRIEPASAKISRGRDPLDNELWEARFPDETEHLFVRAESEVETLETNPFDFVLKSYALEFPFEYEPVFKFPLAPYLAPPFPETQRRLQQWLDEHFAEHPRNTVEMLSAFNSLIFDTLRYSRREEHGIQSSIDTLTSRSGACRDFAVLFVELCRTLGLAARFVSGYLFAPPDDNHRTAGAMHAWVEIYLPGAGWKALDPTHGVWCDDLFVAVAHGAQADTVNPVQGKIYADQPVTAKLEVDVTIEPVSAPTKNQIQSAD